MCSKLCPDFFCTCRSFEYSQTCATTDNSVAKLREMTVGKLSESFHDVSAKCVDAFTVTDFLEIDQSRICASPYQWFLTDIFDIGEPNQIS